MKKGKTGQWVCGIRGTSNWDIGTVTKESTSRFLVRAEILGSKQLEGDNPKIQLTDV